MRKHRKKGRLRQINDHLNRIRLTDRLKIYLMKRAIMKKIALIPYILFVFYLTAQVPFQTIYLEIEKVRFEGEEEHIRNSDDNIDLLDKYRSVERIWVNVPENSYLMIEEPDEDNYLVEKNGRLKFRDRHYTLDYSLNFAWDATEVPSEHIVDNYTAEIPNFKYFDSRLVRRVMITTLDGVRRRAHIYAYMQLDPVDEDQTLAYISEIESSDMPDEYKEMEIAAAREALERKAVRYIEWIWVDEDGNELNMFLRKHEMMRNVKIEYNVRKIEVDIDFDNSIFEETLSKFRIREVRG